MTSLTIKISTSRNTHKETREFDGTISYETLIRWAQNVASGIDEHIGSVFIENEIGKNLVMWSTDGMASTPWLELHNREVAIRAIAIL